MGYLAIIYVKLLERKFKAQERVEAEKRLKTENQLTGYIKFAEKKKGLATTFLEELIENGAPEKKCMPYANSVAELEQEISEAKNNLENFRTGECVFNTCTVQPFYSGVVEEFTKEGREVYLRTTGRIESKYSQRRAASAATA